MKNILTHHNAKIVMGIGVSVAVGFVAKDLIKNNTSPAETTAQAVKVAVGSWLLIGMVCEAAESYSGRLYDALTSSAPEEEIAPTTAP